MHPIKMIFAQGSLLFAFVLPVMASTVADARPSSTFTIKNSNPLIYYHGRWDASPGTWWASSGFKLNVKNLRSLSLNLGEHTTSPSAAIGVSIDGAGFFSVNASVGTNVIPIATPLPSVQASSSIVRINVEGWQDNRINLESITLNSDAALLPYTPSRLTFQFIGDSLSAGQFLPMGVDQAWPFLVGESLEAEHRINAQPGATLTDILSYGNVHGVSYQYFETEDTGYYYTTDHNFTTPWNFARDRPQATHIVIHIGANDASQNVSDTQFVQVYTDFVGRLRTINPTAPIFVFTPWGWPAADGSISYYYPGQYQTIVSNRQAKGDHNIFLVNTTGWVTWADVFPDNQHPTVAGHVKIAHEFLAWLAQWRGGRPL